MGAGESGKSTILKQLRILHDNGFTSAELEQLVAHINVNIMENMNAIITAMQQLTISFASPSARIWSDSGVQEAYLRRNEFQVTDSIKYFIESIDRITEPGYKPTDKDVLYARIPTKGVTQVIVPFREFNLQVVDVAGQRSERRKWLSCFDDVEAVMFVIAMSEYDQVLREDGVTNRLLEALEVFGNICNHECFAKSSMIVFLNKRDLFEEKIERVSLACYFADFEGPQTYGCGVQFIARKVRDQNLSSSKRVYMHETCATDTDQVKFVLDSCLDMIMQQNLKKIGVVI